MIKVKQYTTIMRFLRTHDSIFAAQLFMGRPTSCHISKQFGTSITDTAYAYGYYWKKVTNETVAHGPSDKASYMVECVDNLRKKGVKPYEAS